MAMMIVKFHKLIQSKTVWYIVLGVILIAFVGFFTPTMGNKSPQAKSRDMGEIFGEKVTQQEYRRALQNTHIWYILSSGSMPDMSRELTEALQQQSWERLIVLRKAAAEKVIVTDQEVVQQIQGMPVFLNQNGVFDANIYRAILQNIGLTPRQVEGVFREQIAIHKLMIPAMQAALVSPYELKNAYHLYTDKLVLQTAVLPSEQVEKGVSVTREEAEAFFAENQEAFRMPARVRVSYVEFPVADFLAEAELPEGAALEIYNRNIEAYRIETTNELADVEYKLFEDVEEEITEQLMEYAARRLAVEQATTLVAAIAPRAQNETPDFKGAATTAGLEIKTRPAFAPADELPGIDSTAPFKQAAFGLQDDIYSSFSDAVVGKDSVYVLSLEQRNESFLPTFDIVESDVMSAARSQAARDALIEKTIEMQKDISAALADGTSFEDAMKPYGLSVETTEEFDLSSEFDHEYADTLIQASLTVEQGTLCQPMPVEPGFLFAYVAERTSLDSSVGLAAVREELINGLSGARAQRLLADWQDALVREADLKIGSE